jgi:hypothetical protein
MTPSTSPTERADPLDTLNPMAEWTRAAARNNADWCDALCRTHGAHTNFRRGRVDESNGGPRWDTVRDAGGLSTWEQAWQADDGPSGLFQAELLDNDAVAVVETRTTAGVVAGAVLNRSSDAIGISNFFVSSRAPASTWADCVAFAETLYPESTLVSYTSGKALPAALASGFATAGPLRVWRCDA